MDAVQETEFFGVVLREFGAIELEDGFETFVFVEGLEVVGEGVVGVVESQVVL